MTLVRLTTAVLREWNTTGTPRRVGYLAGYLEAECARREASKRAALLRRCTLLLPKGFDDYDWSAMSWPEVLESADLLGLSFLKGREDPVLVDDVGCGRA